MHAVLDSPAIDKAAQGTIHVLLIEDDVALAEAIADYLTRQGMEVSIENRGDGAMARVEQCRPDLVILDVMLPGKDGLEVCRELRGRNLSVPVLMLTAKDEDIDQVLGLEMGADDYLSKPVQPRVLLARIKAITRRAHATAHREGTTDILQFGRLRVHGSNREVTLGDERIELSPAEFDLLWLLASNAGKVMQRGEILKSLRGLHYNGADRSVDARLYRLRRRFGADNEASWKIKTVRPHGYMFCKDAW
jgi:two-component system, OmpR family, response regulator